MVQRHHLNLVSVYGYMLRRTRLCILNQIILTVTGCLTYYCHGVHGSPQAAL
jgi:hypothetical protein